MLIPNNPDLDFQELNRRIEAEVQRYKLDTRERPMPAFDPSPAQVFDRPYGWMELIQLDDEPLLLAAYPSLLGRKAERSEIQQGLHKLRSGFDKFEVLAALRYSPEGMAHGTEVHGLRKAKLKNTLRRIPVVGKLLLSAYAMASIEPRSRYYVARMDLLTRQHKLQNDSLAMQRDHIENQARQIQIHNEHLEELGHYVNELNGYLKAQQLALDGQSLALENQNAAHAEQTDYIKRLESELDQQRQIQQELRARLGHLERAPRPAAAPLAADSSVVATQPAASNRVPSSIPDSFYLAFENRFRGDALTIRERQSYYLPILEGIAPLNAGLPLVDIGCGRGEWLNMLPDRYTHIGIDLNSMNVEACHEQGLKAIQQDALVWLAEQPENSVAVVCAFHVIEHLSFEQFNTLLDQCQRVLAPGGTIIFETPNPENIISAATHFHTDPTHIHPLPPAFTEFLVEFKGFENVEIHRLNPIPRQFALDEDSEVARRCDALFYGPQDYAVTARKGQL
ncbi:MULTISPECIES: class I SAM-dependent methyltransferase [unclassified Pseudomonas]|uniref:class I SAM-dependent methyltransferase n=1 Tax=unclassified Pseudomonas TaxID=196821 RepID=UPI0025DADFFE|nr:MULTISPECIES: methyltransferase domain-containing protein [unclassified Pseudomonas]